MVVRHMTGWGLGRMAEWCGGGVDGLAARVVGLGSRRLVGAEGLRIF